MARSSRPRRRYAPERPAFQLTLTRGGGAELVELASQEMVWASVDDPDFREEFTEFLHVGDLYDILNYLEDTGELTARDADLCAIREEFIDGAEMAGLMPLMR